MIQQFQTLILIVLSLILKKIMSSLTYSMKACQERRLSKQISMQDFKKAYYIKEDNVIFNLLDESRSRVAIVETDIDAGFLKGLVDEHIDSFEAYTGIITNQNTSSNMTSIYGPSSPGTMKVENFMLSQINT